MEEEELTTDFEVSVDGSEGMVGTDEPTFVGADVTATAKAAPGICPVADPGPGSTVFSPAFDVEFCRFIIGDWADGTGAGMGKEPTGGIGVEEPASFIAVDDE